jgi:hypothetical protein
MIQKSKDEPRVQGVRRVIVAAESTIVQGAGHVIFADGTKCARYEDAEGDYYFRHDLYTEEYMIYAHGTYVMN